MRAVIAGGRNYVVGPKQRRWLDGVRAALDITEVISGAAPGADAGGEKWARLRDIPVKRFPADWKTHGRSAGPKRNAAMAHYCRHGDAEFICKYHHDDPQHAVILFPGGMGTANMKRNAAEQHLLIIEYRDYET